MNNLQEKFNKEIQPAIMKEFGYDNKMQCPKVEKISVNVGLSQAAENKEFIKNIEDDLKLVLGQSPVITKAKKSIAGFKTRQGQTFAANLRSTTGLHLV